MRILFIARHPGYIRHYRSTIELLARRGHEIILAFNKSGGDTYRLEDIFDTSGFSNIVVVDGLAPLRRGVWQFFAKGVRYGQDYLRYFDKRYQRARKLKERVRKKVPFFMQWVVETLNSTVGVEPLRRALRFMERVIPPDRNIDSFIRRYSPDVILITPVVGIASGQTDYLKSAKALGIRTGLCVASWDNLTTKGLIKIEPDRVFLWNEALKEEAIGLHSISPSKVVVTGAQCYDHWFDFKPSTTREDFCRAAGLDPKKPYILYLCSSRFIAPDEVPFVKRWIKFIRSGGNPAIKDMGILIRPHFQNAKQWLNADLSEFENVTIFPPEGENVIDTETRARFYDSIYHSSAVVGLNTSAMIEAGILLKPVFTIVSPENRDTQEGTLHFHHLVKGGLLYIGKDFEEHFEQLCRVLDGDDSYKERIKEFIKYFVRPHGLDVPCTPIFAAEVERLGRIASPQPEHPPVHLRALRPLLIPVAALSLLLQKFLRKKGSAKRTEAFKGADTR